MSPFAQSYAAGYGDYDFTLRALPPRHNPSYSLRSSIANGVDLVTPHCAPCQPSIAASVPEPPFQRGLWGERVVIGKTPPANPNEGLSALFGKGVGAT